MHTKGPWKTDRSNNIRKVDPNDQRIIASTSGVARTSREEGSNARLIAAAPELLEALMELKKQIHAHYKMNVKKDFSLLLADAAASKAIAKVEGKI